MVYGLVGTTDVRTYLTLSANVNRGCAYRLFHNEVTGTTQHLHMAHIFVLLWEGRHFDWQMDSLIGKHYRNAYWGAQAICEPDGNVLKE